MFSSTEESKPSSPRAVLQEFGVTNETRGIMKASQTDDEGFALPKKSKGRRHSKNANSNLADTRATDNAMELLTSSTSPTRLGTSTPHSPRPSPSDTLPSLSTSTRIARSASRDLSKLSRKGLLLLAEQNNIDVSFVSHDIEEMRRFLSNESVGESESKESRSASMPSLEGDSEDEKKRESSFEHLPISDSSVDAAKSTRYQTREEDSVGAIKKGTRREGVDSARIFEMRIDGEDSVSTVNTGGGAIVIDESHFVQPADSEVALSPLISSASSSTAKKKKKKNTSPPAVVVPVHLQEATTTKAAEELAKSDIPIVSESITKADSSIETTPKKAQQTSTKVSSPLTRPAMTTTPNAPAIVVSSEATKSARVGKVLNKTRAGESNERTEKDRLAREWEFKHSLPRDLTRLTISIGDFRTFGASPGNPLATDGHVRFRIVRQLDEDGNLSPQVVFRRFRDFQALYLRLAHLFPLEVIPALPAPSLPSFFKSDEFLYKRARRLEAFIYCLLRMQSKDVLQNEDLSAFLLKESEEFDELAVKYLGNQGKDATVPPLAVSEKLSSGLSMLMSKFASSAGASDDQRMSSPSSASASAMSGSGDDVKGEISTSYEALQITIDHHGQPQERVQIWENLVDSLEQLGSVTIARASLMARLNELVSEVASPTMMANGEGDESKLLGEVLDPVNEINFVKALSGANKPVCERNQQGTLKVAHQAAAILGGAKTMHARVAATPSEIPDAHLRESARDVMAKFDRVKRETSGLAVDLVQEFGRISLERAQNELERLQALKASIMQM